MNHLILTMSLYKKHVALRFEFTLLHLCISFTIILCILQEQALNEQQKEILRLQSRLASAGRRVSLNYHQPSNDPLFNSVSSISNTGPTHNLLPKLRSLTIENERVTELLQSTQARLGDTERQMGELRMSFSGNYDIV